MKDEKKKLKKKIVIFSIFGVLMLLVMIQITWNKNGSLNKLILPDIKEGVIEPDLMALDYNYTECLIKTSDNVLSKLPRENWTDEMYAEEQAGNAKQGYITICKPSGWGWGNLEIDPKRYAIVKFPTSEFNKSWLEPEYNYSSPLIELNDSCYFECIKLGGRTCEFECNIETGQYKILTQRKYKLPLETFMTPTEIDELKNITYGEYINWTIKTDIVNVSNKIELVDYENRNDDLILHGSSGYFTICLSGCNYTSLAGFESGEDSDLTGTGPAIANITEGFMDTTSVTFGGWTTTVNDYIEIFVDSTARHHGVWNESAYILNTSDTAIFIQEYNIRIDGIQINLSTAGYGIRINGAYNSNVDIRISNSIIKGSASSRRGIYSDSDYGGARVWNTIITGFTSPSYGQAIYADSNSGLWNISNSILSGNRIGLARSKGAVSATNVASFNNTDDFSGAVNITYSASDDGDCDDATCIQPSNWSTVFVDYENRDFHLKGTDTDLKDRGIDLSSWGYYTTDIDGETRTGTWDIGADEYVTAEPVTDTCTCPEVDTDWEIDHSDFCNITTECNLGTGTLNFTGVGTTRVNSTINSTNLGDPLQGFLRLLSNATIFVKSIIIIFVT